MSVIKQNNEILKEQVKRWTTITIIFLFTFPVYYGYYDTGLDPSYLWGLNWLFVNDYQMLTELIYPFAPLAFLKIPVAIGHNLFFAILFYSILKIGFIWLMFNLSDTMEKANKITVIFIVFIVSFFMNIDFLIIGCCLILNLIYYKNRNFISFIISVLLAFIGLFIKISIGISALSIVGVSVLVSLYHSKDIKLLLKQTGIVVVIGFITGILVFKKASLYFHFLIGTFKLSGGYDEVLSLHPYNNWLLLGFFLFLMILFPFICREKDVRIACLLSVFSLFAAWKHSVVREDIYHYSILLTFLFLFWGIIFLVTSKEKLTLLIASVTILLLYANMRNVNIPEYRGIKKEIAGINNFRDVLNYRTFKQKAFSISENNVAKNRLSPELQEIIGDATVDVYPWDFSYIAANQFKWKPRKTLELGASSSRWASEKASENYLLKENMPQFILFHTETDRHGGKFGSIDDRHILNDEPLVIYNLLNNYTLQEKTDKFLLFKRNTVSRFENIDLDEIQDYKFGEWIDIPSHTDKIIRLKVFSKNTFIGKIIKILYKETSYFIDYQFEAGIILTYRYIPATAVDGLWCNPFIRYPNTAEIESKVVKIRLRNANPVCVKESFKTQFQHITLKSELRDLTGINNVLFHKSITPSKKVLVDMTQQFDNELTKSTGFSRKVEKNGYSYTYKIDLDSLFRIVDTDTLIIETNVNAINYFSDAGLVISTEGTGADFWEVTYLPYSISKKLWHYSYLNKLITKDKHASGILKVYVYNFGYAPVYVDNFRVCISF